MTAVDSTEEIKAENTIERILATALDHFSNFGYLGASVREITAAAGVTKPTLYYYFRNKEDLYRLLASSSFEKMFLGLGAPSNFSGRLTDNFCALVKSYYDFVEKDISVARFIQVLSFTPCRDVPEVGATEFRKKIELLIDDQINLAFQKNEISQDFQFKLRLILQGLFSLACERRLNGSIIPVEEIRQTIESLMVS